MKTMNETIELLGQQILSSEEYVAFKQAETAYQADAKLSALVNEFDVCRNQLVMTRNEEGSDEIKVSEIQDKMEKLYNSIMENENMKQYNEAAGKFEALMKHVFDSINTAVFGPQECTHNCATCSGCH